MKPYLATAAVVAVIVAAVMLYRWLMRGESIHDFRDDFPLDEPATGAKGE